MMDITKRQLDQSRLLVGHIRMIKETRSRGSRKAMADYLLISQQPFIKTRHRSVTYTKV